MNLTLENPMWRAWESRQVTFEQETEYNPKPAPSKSKFVEEVSESRSEQRIITSAHYVTVPDAQVFQFGDPREISYRVGFRNAIRSQYGDRGK